MPVMIIPGHQVEHCTITQK